MANNPHAPGRSKSTSFRWDEIKAMTQLFEILLAGRDPSVVIRSKSVGSAMSKFVNMKRKLEQERADEGLPL